MSNPATGTLQIPNDVLQPIINAHVAGAIAEALGDRSRLITEAVRVALTTRVDRDGKPTYHDSPSYPTFLQWLVSEAIRKAATEAVQKIVAEDAEKISEFVSKELKNRRSVIGKALVEGVIKTATDRTRLSVSLKVEGIPDYR